MKKHVLKRYVFYRSLTCIGISKFTPAEAHTHTDSCYNRCQGMDYNCDAVINDNDLFITENGSTVSITFILDGVGSIQTGIAISFKNKITGTAILQYSITQR